MANDNRITFFACGNGDTSLIEAHGLTIMTDINYRVNGANDENDDDIPDFAPKIREACDNDSLDIFVLTHSDEDHLRGFCELYHVGPPTNRDDDPDEGDVKIIIDEMWCSEYAANPNYTTDASKPVLDEIKRRKILMDTVSGKLNGNRLRILTADDGELENITNGIHWRLLAPNADEGDIPKAPEGAPKNSSNPSSLVIQWTITVGGKSSKVMLGGDSTVEIWERLNADYNDDALQWHIMLSPHHCSRHSMGRKENIGTKDERFIYSQNALNGLDHPIGERPHVVASSRKFGKNHPPHEQAREKYYKILASGDDVTDEVRRRFKCTSGKKGSDKLEDIVFKFTSSGPVLAALATPAIIVGTAATGGGGYG